MVRDVELTLVLDKFRKLKTNVTQLCFIFIKCLVIYLRDLFDATLCLCVVCSLLQRLPSDSASYLDGALIFCRDVIVPIVLAK